MAGTVHVVGVVDRLERLRTTARRHGVAEGSPLDLALVAIASAAERREPAPHVAPETDDEIVTATLRAWLDGSAPEPLRVVDPRLLVRMRNAG